MEDYSSNSHKSKQPDSTSKTTEERKKLDKVVSGAVKTKKKSKFEAFLADDVENVKNYVLQDVLVPAVKKAISDIVTNGIDMMLYGEVRDKKRYSSSTRVSYNRYYDDRDRSSNRDGSRGTNRTRDGYSYDDIILDNRGEAEEVLSSLDEIVSSYGTASVADLFDLVGVTGNYTDNKYGWTNLRNARVERTHDGGYLLKMPRALPLDR